MAAAPPGAARHRGRQPRPTGHVAHRRCSPRRSCWSGATPSRSCWRRPSGPSSPCGADSGGGRPRSGSSPASPARSGSCSTVPALDRGGARGPGPAHPLASFPRAAAVAGPALGTLGYLVYSWVRFDDFWEPFSVQETFRGDAQDPVTRLFEGVGELFGSDTFGDGLHLPFAIGFVVLLVVAFRRLPLSYGAYAAAVLLRGAVGRQPQLAGALRPQRVPTRDRPGLRGRPRRAARAGDVRRSAVQAWCRSPPWRWSGPTCPEAHQAQWVRGASRGP